MLEENINQQQPEVPVETTQSRSLPITKIGLFIGGGIGFALLAIATLVFFVSQDRGLDPESASEKTLTKYDLPMYPNEIDELSMLSLDNPVFGVEFKDEDSALEIRRADYFTSCSSNSAILKSLTGAESLSSRVLNEEAGVDEYFLYSDRVSHEIVKFNSPESANLFAESVKEGVFDATCDTGLTEDTYYFRDDIEYTVELNNFNKITKDVPKSGNIQAFEFEKQIKFSPAVDDASWFDIVNETRIGVAVKGADVMVARFTKSYIWFGVFDSDSFKAEADKVLGLAIERFFETKS